MIENHNLESINSLQFQQAANQFALDCISRPMGWDKDRQECVDILLRISNTLYNNTTRQLLPLDDGVYDQLLVAYKRYNPHYQVGSTEVRFEEPKTDVEPEKKVLYQLVPDHQIRDHLYVDQIGRMHSPYWDIRPEMKIDPNTQPITKRLINTTHKYPELVGTLDKCKFVLNHQAFEAGVLDTPTVQVFERDFIQACMASGIILPNEVFQMVGELKYDGVSVEAEVCKDRIITALSRGDTGENIATDLTPVFKNYWFYNAVNLTSNEVFGIKFEAVITHRNLDRLARLRGKSYKNSRNAVVGLLGASDAYKYIDYITLIPIATSISGISRIDELEFLNKYYSTGEINRYCVFNGNYQEILFHVKQFTEAAEIVRPVLPYMIDGVVVSFTDSNKKSLLGRVNSVNKWQIAIKFNPKETRTIFQGYTYNIGKTGEVIPMAHFKPVEFIGTIHTKQSVHSFQRYRELALIRGQEIDIKYVNDVLTYITKPDTDLNRHLQATQIPEEFIAVCPYCGSKIVLSETMKSAKCPNQMCHERRLMVMVDMVERLGFKDISEEAIRALDLLRFLDLVAPYTIEELTPILGPLTAEKFLEYQRRLLSEPIEDYKIMAAMSFDGLAEEKWKKILKVYKLSHIYKMGEQGLRINLSQISGIGPAIVQAIIEGFTLFKNDMDFIVYNMNLIDYSSKGSLPKVVLTGTRDPELVNIIRSLGYDCEDNYQVTKDTALVITADPNSSSGKISKALKYGIKIMSVQDFLRSHNLPLPQVM